jgi:hypothetical protein
MAVSHSHKFGQIIGDLLELAIEPHLKAFTEKHSLHLDKKGDRPARKGKKVTWVDNNGNKHDLDFVIERGGNETKIGQPIAFIESAWRRYTKHSRNKVQEVQSAILPLQAKYHGNSPFIGVILAGVFTGGAITQLESIGFNVLYFTYDSVIAAFAKFGIDANFNEQTDEEDFVQKIESWEKSEHKEEIGKYLFEINKANVDKFFSSLEVSVSRFIEQVIILALHGQQLIITSISDAIELLSTYEEDLPCPHPIDHYDITIKYNTGDKINATFKAKADAISFLNSYM